MKPYETCYRPEICSNNNICYITLRPFKENMSDAGLVWNSEANDSVWVKKEFITPKLTAEVRQRMAEKQYKAFKDYGGLPNVTDSEIKSCLERTYHTTIGVNS